MVHRIFAVMISQHKSQDIAVVLLCESSSAFLLINLFTQIDVFTGIGLQASYWDKSEGQDHFITFLSIVHKYRQHRNYDIHVYKLKKILKVTLPILKTNKRTKEDWLETFHTQLSNFSSSQQIHSVSNQNDHIVRCHLHVLNSWPNRAFSSLKHSDKQIKGTIWP